MQLAKGIRRHGFRKWYERELLQSHAHLTLAFLCTIGLLVAVEMAMQFTSWQERVSDVLVVTAYIGVGLWALRRYLYLLSHAEHVANQADCPACGTYGRLTLVGEPATEDSTAVSCRQCAHEWRIDG
ncbi:hypothetical protein [Ideonella sp. A 288]|uniref:hypothetical protein n=1 Tax=Ideonella sp. A 288 TaxID=1962181 RepID=UPI000B4BA059|nr:hypothetical protein [Ideonella sp. A 288]